MKLTLKKTFLKDLEQVIEPRKRDVKTFLEQLANDPACLETLTHIKKLRSKKKGNFFRIRFGDYRLGYEQRTDELILYRILHRREIYRYFP